MLEEHTGHSQLAGAAGQGGGGQHLLRASRALGTSTERLLRPVMPLLDCGWQKTAFCSTVGHGHCGVEQASLRGWRDPMLVELRCWDGGACGLGPGVSQCSLREDVPETLSSQALLPLSWSRRMPRPRGASVPEQEPIRDRV